MEEIEFLNSIQDSFFTTIYWPLKRAWKNACLVKDWAWSGNFLNTCHWACSVNKLQCFLYKLLNKALITCRDIFGHFCENISQPLITGNVGEGYDCFHLFCQKYKLRIGTYNYQSTDS